ncbi:MAG TPA: transposase [Xanthobacteraceae bacterium]
MTTKLERAIANLLGEQPSVDQWVHPTTVQVDTYAGRVQIEWDAASASTALGQLPFFVEYLKTAGLFDAWVADCPLEYRSPNSPAKRDVLGTMLLSVLAGHWRYAHMTALRGDAVLPELLGMKGVVSEDAVRRGVGKIDEPGGVEWCRQHLDYTTFPALVEPWILDVDTTIKPLFGHQEGAVVSFNPHKPGRPSHAYHTYMVANLRLVLDVEIRPGDEHTSNHTAPGLWALLDRLGRDRWPAMLRGDAGFGNEPIMSEAERRALPYLFKLRVTANVKKAITRAMGQSGWTSAGCGWEGKEDTLRLIGWSRQRRIMVLRRRLNRPLAIAERDENGQLSLGFAEVGPNKEVYEYAVLVMSLDSEIRTIGQLYRDRADCENAFDELKNHWGWGGFTTRDLHRCRLMARIVALAYNWWNIYVRLVHPDRHLEAITSRPLFLHAIARKTRHAGHITLKLSSPHGEAAWAAAALAKAAEFLDGLRKTAEQLTLEQKWYRILSQALRKWLRGRQLSPPPRLAPA